jgi:alpha-beta hydrolase superfamily lysophospholipase
MLKSQDGIVFYREWNCPSTSLRAVIILVHGLGGYSGRFFEFGPYLAKNGLQVYAIELKGFGESPSIKGHINNFQVYTKELKALVETAKKLHAGKKIFMFGESMGGLIAIDFSIHHQDMIDGMILISPAVKDKMPYTLKQRAEILRAALFDPLAFFPSGFTASIFTRDPVMAKRIDNDPLEVRNLTAKFFLSILKTMLFVNTRPRAIKLPVLMLLAGKDAMISAEAAQAYFNKLSSKDKELKWYNDMYHALYADKDRENVFKDILSWVNKHL